MKSARTYYNFRLSIKALAIAFFFLFVSFKFVTQTFAAAGINKVINFQGKVVNKTAGTNVANATYPMVFTIYDKPSGGTALWTENDASVSVTDGIFHVGLGVGTVFPANFNFNQDGLFLDITFNSEQMGSRVQLTAVPYAFNAGQVAGLTVQDDSGNASTSGTLRVGNGKTITFSNGLTFTGTDTTSFAFPSSGGNIVTEGFTQSLTNKTIGSTGLTFSAATTDVTTGTDEDFTITPNGLGNINLGADFNSQVLIGASGATTEFPLLVRSGIGNNAAFAVDNLNNGNLFVASASGVNKFIIDTNGVVTAAGGLTLTSGPITLGGVTGSGSCLLGGATAAWGSCGSGGSGTNWWNQTSGAGGGFIAPFNGTVDFLLGFGGSAAASTSAKFAVLNLNSGIPMATIAGTLSVNAPMTGLTTGPIATISGRTNNALLVLDNEAQSLSSDLLAASSAGVMKFLIDKNGDLTLGGAAYNSANYITATNFSVSTAGLITSVGLNAGSGQISGTGGLSVSGSTTLAATGGNTVAIGNSTGAMTLSASTLSLTTASTNTFNLADNIANALDIQEGTSNYINVNTTNSSEELQFGNTSTNPKFTFLGSGIASFSGTLDIHPSVLNFTTGPIATISGKTASAVLVINNNNTGDLLTASQGGNAKFTITSAGGIKLGTSEGSSGNCLLSGGAGAAATFGSCGSGGGGGSNWTLDTTNGLLRPNNNTVDLLIGGTATSSAKFAFLNNNSGTPLASIAGRLNVSASMTGLTTGPVATIAGRTNNALLILDNEAQSLSSDLLTASSAGTTKFTIDKNGYVGLAGSAVSSSNYFTSANFVVSNTGGLYLGANNIGSGGVDGLLTFYSSGSGIADPTISADASGNLTIQATQAGASVIVGDGSGNISLSLTAAADVLIADKTVTLAGAYTGDDFMFMRVFTGGANSQGGSILKIHDTSGGSGTINGDLLLVNSALTSGNFTGNLAAFQHNGVTKLTIQGSGTSPVLKITGSTSFAGLVVDNAGVGDLLTASASGTTKFTIANSGNLTATGTLTGLTGLTLASGPITLGGVTGSGLCINGGASAAWGSCGAGGSSPFNLNASSGTITAGITTADFIIGGTSTGSADFVFGGLNHAGGSTPTATFSGDLIINNKPNTSDANMQRWNQITGTAGAIGTGVTTAIASISASAIFNGSLYVGTNKANGAEIYRYNGPTATSSAQWMKVSQTISGQIASGGTSNIDSISSMTVYNGSLYIGTTELNSAEVYRYDGGTTWTKITAAAGTVRAGGGTPTASIDGIASMAVHGGHLYIGTQEGAKAEIYRYDGGVVWIVLNTTAGLFVTTNTANVNSISSMISFDRSLYFIAEKLNDTDFGRYSGVPGGTGVGVIFNAAGATGSYNVYNTETGAAAAVTGFDTGQLAVFNGKIILALSNYNTSNVAEVLEFTAVEAPASAANTFVRLTSAAGTIGPTASIDAISAITIYNGRLYVGTAETNAAGIYRYDGNKVWTKVSQNTAGQIAAGGTSAIDIVSNLVSFNHNSLFAGILEGTATEGFMYQSSVDQSYALKFHAAGSAGGGEQNNQQNLASIFFVASLSANLNNKMGNTGAFVFSHNIVTNSGSYDVAEDYPTRDETLEPGDVVSVDPNERGFVKKSEGDYDYTAIGVYSENPALRLSQDIDQINGGRVIPIALAGRAPVKVSTENGEIKNGDPLTPSSVPGVAMKAKKSGLIIGQAMEPFACSQTTDHGLQQTVDGSQSTVSQCQGKVMAYIKSSSYDGSIAENFAGIDVNSESFGSDVLTALKSQDTGLSGSDIVTDRLIANIEIVSPKITVDTLFAKNIKADHIEGLDLLTERISSLESKIATIGATLTPVPVVDKQKELMERLTAELSSASSSAQLTSNNVSLTSLSSGGLASVSGNLRVKGNGLFEGILTVIDTLTTNNFIANGLSTFFGEVIFKSNVKFDGTATFGNDVGGNGVIVKDDKRVEIVFDKEFEQIPIVNASVSFDEQKDDQGNIINSAKLEQAYFAQGYSYIIVDKSTKGFTIVLNKKAKDDINFTWTALRVKDAKSIQSRAPN